MITLGPALDIIPASPSIMSSKRLDLKIDIDVNTTAVRSNEPDSPSSVMVDTKEWLARSNPSVSCGLNAWRRRQ
jgi:hypothetical protein